MKQRQGFLLRRRLEVNKHVAAGNQVEVGKRRVFEDIVGREHDHLAQRVADLVTVAVLLEITRQPLLGDLAKTVFVVDPAAGKAQRPAVDVGGENFYLGA